MLAEKSQYTFFVFHFTWFPVFTSFCKNLIDFFHDYRYTTCIIEALCDEVEILLKKYEDHTRKDIEFHTAIALSSKNVVVPRLLYLSDFILDRILCDRVFSEEKK